MYAFPEMLSLCNQKWKSESHRLVAEKLLIGNSRVVTRNQLIELSGLINRLSKKEVEALTIEGAIKLGIPF